MSKERIGVLKLALAIAILGIMFISFDRTSFAGEYGAPFIIVESYDVDGDIIVAGEDFDLHLTVKNVDLNRAAHNLVISIMGSAGISPAYGSVPQVYIGDLNPGEAKEVTFSCTAAKSCAPPSTLFSVQISADSRSNSVPISVPVEKKEDDITIISAFIPEEAFANDAIASEIRFKIVGEDNYSDVAMVTSVDGIEYDYYRIGNMRAGATKTQNATMYLYETGKHEVSFTIEFVDSKGNLKSVEAYKGYVDVKEKPADSAPIVVADNKIVYSSRDLGIMVGCVLGSLVLLAGIIFVLRKHKNR